MIQSLLSFFLGFFSCRKEKTYFKVTLFLFSVRFESYFQLLQVKKKKFENMFP